MEETHRNGNPGRIHLIDKDNSVTPYVVFHEDQ